MGVLESILRYEENSRKKLAVREIIFCSNKFAKIYNSTLPPDIVEMVVNDEWIDNKELYQGTNLAGGPPSYLSLAVGGMALKYWAGLDHLLSSEANSLWFHTFGQLLLKLSHMIDSGKGNASDMVALSLSYEVFNDAKKGQDQQSFLSDLTQESTSHSSSTHGPKHSYTALETRPLERETTPLKKSNNPSSKASFEIHWMWLVVIIPVVFIGAIVLMLIFSENREGATVVRAQPEQPIKDHLQDTNFSLQDDNTLIKNDALAVSYHSETKDVDSSDDLLQNDNDVVTSSSQPNSILQSHVNSEETSIEPQNFNSTQNLREDQIFQIPEKWEFLAKTGTGYFVYATTKEETTQHFRSYFKIETVEGGEELGVGAVSKEECASYMKELTLAPVTPAGIISNREVISVLPTENTIAGIMVRHLCSLKNERSEVPANNPNQPYNDEEEHDLYFYEQGEHGENDDF